MSKSGPQENSKWWSYWLFPNFPKERPLTHLIRVVKVSGLYMYVIPLNIFMLDSLRSTQLWFASWWFLSLCSLPISVIDLTAQRFIWQCGCRDLITWRLFCTAIPVAKLSKHIPLKQPPSYSETTKGDSYFSCSGWCFMAWVIGYILWPLCLAK